MSLLEELKRRNVIRVGVAYGVLSWLILQMGDLLFDLMGLPDWALRIVLGILVLGFVPALIFSWVYELTPEGLKRESEIPEEQSITAHTAKKLDMAVIALLVAVAALSFVNRGGHDADKGEMGSGSIPPVEIEPDPISSSPSAEPGKVSIAVLPFSNLSGDDEALPFTNGLHDDLLTQLARIDGLKVISRTSVLEYRDTTKNMRTIGEELGVSHLVEGGVQRAGNRVRINAQLIDSITDEHLWANTFDRELTVSNIFDMQSEIATEIARALRINLSVESESGFGRPTENLQAYEAYMRGRAQLDSSDYLVESMEATREEFLEAIRLDPDFAQAHARLALATDVVFWFGGRNTMVRERALKSAEEALRLQPDLPEANQALASIYYHGYLDYDRALDVLSKAEESLAGEVWPLVTRGAILRRSGDPGFGIEQFEQALELNPRGPLMYGDLIGSYKAAGRFDDARAMARELARLNVPEHYSAYKLGEVDWHQRGDGRGMVAAAEAHGAVDVDGSWIVMFDLAPALWSELGDAGVLDYLDRMQREGRQSWVATEVIAARYRELDATSRNRLGEILAELQARVVGGDQEPGFRLQIAEALIHLDRFDEARNLLSSLLTDPVITRDRFEGQLWVGFTAYLFTAMGDHDQAIAALEFALADHTHICLKALTSNPGMDALQDHPGFADLVARHGWTFSQDKSQGIEL